MIFDIVIPTLHRVDKLKNCIKSIINAKKDYDIYLYIYFSDLKEFEYFKNTNNYSWIIFKYIENYRVPDFWNSHLQQMTSDAIICLNDDILIYENFFDVINKEFTDLDSIMGINQVNLSKEQALDSAYCVIGKKYAERFPNKQIWCPEYYRFFADKELGLFAKSINKFKFCKEVKINHLHPCIDISYMDQTHKDVRKYLKQDSETFYKRQSLNYLWGRDYNLLER